MGITVTSAIVFHAIEAGAWAAAYQALGALPNNKSAMLYSLSAMTSYGNSGTTLPDKMAHDGGLGSSQRNAPVRSDHCFLVRNDTESPTYRRNANGPASVRLNPADFDVFLDGQPRRCRASELMGPDRVIRYRPDFGTGGVMRRRHAPGVAERYAASRACPLSSMPKNALCRNCIAIEFRHE